MRILFIGGNGTISAFASRLAVERGHDLTLLNRGTSSRRAPIDGAESLVGDAEDVDSVRAAIGSRDFDVVVNWRSFHPSQVESDVALFEGRTGQYVYISSASAYAKPVAALPITESTALRNPFWEYSRNKIASEDVLVRAFRDRGFPVTIVRPSHTYDEQAVPLPGGWTMIDRARRGKPVVVHGDGTSLWTMTHSRDFAPAFVGLLGQPAAIGEAVQITSDEAMPWNQIHASLAAAAGVEPEYVHIASASLVAAIPEWSGPLLGDQAHSVIFDNTKVKRLVPGWAATTPFSAGAREIVAWHDANPASARVDDALDAKLDALVERVRASAD